MPIRAISVRNLTLSLCVIGCASSYGGDRESADAGRYGTPWTVAIIPNPMQVEESAGRFAMTAGARICVDTSANEVYSLAEYLSDTLRESTGHQLEIVKISEHNRRQRNIRIWISGSKDSLGDEGYELKVRPDGVELCAFRPAGLFYGIQTIRQLLATDRKGKSSALSYWLPCVEIKDKPKYRWRGMLLDCVRHFMSKEFIKRYIDLIAYHKLNALHLHLTDDQGWRIEIKKYPRLTEVGAYRGEGDERYGGFYTQDELREIVAYGEKRYVRVVPEIEMPGHASAAIASYPYLSCTGQSIPVATQWGIFEDVFCPGKETTFEFLEDVLAEVMDIFPSPYIHIGGDEVPRKRWKECALCQKRIKKENLENEDQLQSYLIRRVEGFLSGRGRRLIGWDEILEGGGLPKSVVVQSWRGMEGAIEGSRLGHDVISSPHQFVYLNYPQREEDLEVKWMRVTTLEKVYSFDPTPPELCPEESERILGAECTLWSEYAHQEDVDRQMFPRLCAFGEVTWSMPDRRDWEDFSARMKVHYQRLANLGVDYFR